MLDIDLFRDDDHPTAPEPVYSMDALFDRFPFIPRLCRYVIPSASSLHEGRPFKGRGIILFPEPITDKRVYRAIGDSLLAEIDCMLAGVTHNPCAVGFGNTHNAPQAYDNPTPDDAWIQEAVERAKATVLQEAHEIRANREKTTRPEPLSSQWERQGQAERGRCRWHRGREYHRVYTELRRNRRNGEAGMVDAGHRKRIQVASSLQ